MNKNQILKIAGVKSEADFYKKFPTEASFKAKYGKELKKAQNGSLKFPSFKESISSTAPGNCPDGQQKNPLTGACESIPDFGIPDSPQVQSNLGQGFIRNPQTNTYGKPQEYGAESPKGGDFLKTISKYAGPVGKVLQGIDQLHQEKDAVKQAKQASAVSDLNLAASRTRPEEDRRMYDRPEDMVVNPNQRFPSYGTGTNPLAKDGISIGGNRTEIQNMYSDEDTLYTDLGYEPLNDSSQVKQFEGGGMMDMLKKFGGDGGPEGKTPWGKIGNIGQEIGGAAYKNNAGSNIGGSIGGAAGSMFGPAGKAIGQVAGTIIGGALDRNPHRIKAYEDSAMRNANTMGMQQGIQSAMGQHSAFVRNGGNVPYAEDGWMSHNWNPQVIAKFGDMDVSDVQDYASDGLESLRTGGNIRQNNIYPQDRYALGGELQTQWGGGAETISQNPYLPNTGETIMFRGQSHDESDGQGNTGIGVSYGNGGQAEHSEADVEVERNEPAIELPDGLVVYGNLVAPGYKGRKFKNIVEDLSKKEMIQNKIIDKATKQLNDYKVLNPIGITTFNAYSKMIEGANQTLKGIADEKQELATLQSAINDTAEEHGLDADALSKGYTKMDKKSEVYKAMFGKSIPKAQGGTVTAPHNGSRTVDANGNTFVYDSETKNWVPDREWMAKYRSSTTAPTTATPVPTTLDAARVAEITDLYNKAKAGSKGGKQKSLAAKLFQQKYHEYFPDFAKEVILSSPTGVTAKGKGKYKTLEELKKAPINDILSTNVDEWFGPRTEQYMAKLQEVKTPAGTPTITPTITTPNTTTAVTKKQPIPQVPAKQDRLSQLYNMIQPHLRKPYQEGLDPNQLSGEMYSLATNQQDPVQATLFHPELDTPYDISLQDKLNANQADFNALQRTTGYNPAAQMALAAQKYAANDAVLGEQFRMNQAEKAEKRGKNRDLINAAKVQNLGILDQQYTRQAMAKSNTKATTLSALSSISDKMAKNKLENRQLATYSNMFPQYGFDKNMKATNQGLTFFQTPTVGNTRPLYDKQGNPVGYGPDETTTTPETTTPITTQKFGGITRKQIRNGDILKSFKNL